MAFKTYTTLKAAALDWLARSSDTDLSNRVDDFITLAEDRLSRDLRIRQLETALSETIASGVAALPSDFLELKHARVNGQSRPLEVKYAEWIYRRFPIRSSTGVPEFIAVDGSNFVFGPYPDSGYTIEGIYFKKPATVVGGTTNEWTDNAGDALLFGALLEAAPFIKNDQRVNLWQAKYDQIIDGLMDQEKRKMRRGSRVSYN